MSDDEERVTMPFKFVTAGTSSLSCRRKKSQVTDYQQNDNTDYEDPSGFDARFPNQNQTKHCWQNYVDYHKCILAKGEDFKP
ncbi:hypothetical protein KC332_g9215, partial [Hortaea werneckii]